MNAKLEAGTYKERFAFEADFRLVIRNAKIYNIRGTIVSLVMQMVPNMQNWKDLARSQHSAGLFFPKKYSR